MIIMIIAELSGRCRQSPIVLGGEGQSLGTKDALSIGPVDTHLNHVFINSVRHIWSSYFIIFIIISIHYYYYYYYYYYCDFSPYGAFEYIYINIGAL